MSGIDQALSFTGSFNGALSTLPAHELGGVAIKEALNRAKVKGNEVSEVILGQVLTAGMCYHKFVSLLVKVSSDLAPLWLGICEGAWDFQTEITLLSDWASNIKIQFSRFPTF